MHVPGTRGLLQVMKRFPNWIVVMFAQLLKQVNFICKLYSGSFIAPPHTHIKY